MSENTKLWDMLGRTDPKHTKGFTRGGGFKGTAIKPIWSYLRMTEEFGPCGTGWGVNPPTFDVQDCGEERLVFCTASIWYGNREQVCFGVGGDKVIGKNKFGLSTDDEAFKKAYTDAITNALKMIGVGADVHMGLFDDSKYVNAMRDEFAEESASLPIDVERKSSASLKRDGAWQKLMFKLSADFGDVKTRVTLSKLRAEYREMARKDGWPRAWLEALKEQFDSFEDKLPQADDGDDFPGDRPSNAYVDSMRAG
jgi:hypothetical protein